MKPLILIIMDGFGVRKERSYNAVLQAKTPNLDMLKKNYSYTTLKAAGEAVGLPKRQIGSSEVNHMNMGAGRIVYQDIVRINTSIKNGSFFRNKELQKAMDRKKTLHIMGLVSDGGVHSHINHLYALVEMAKKRGVKNLVIHAFLDGRDVPPKSAKKYLQALERKLKKLDLGKISTISGRFYAMDRDKRWQREKKAYQAIIRGKGLKSKDSQSAVDEAYRRSETDEFVTPTIIAQDSNIKKGDTVIFYNFRSDRARQLTHAIIDKNFKKFKTEKLGLYFVSLTEYEKKLTKHIAFPQPQLSNILSEVLSKRGMKQLHIAETEKYAHVTFFFNGGTEKPMKGEDRIMIHSPKVKTYDMKPEMNADKVTSTLLKEIKKKRYGFIVLNLANPDMVGHCGRLKPTIKAVEKTDECVGKIVSEIRKQDGVAIITADHGNAEQMMGKNGQPHTAHTLNPVPCIVVDDKRYRLRKGVIGDIAPTILKLLGIAKPASMKGSSLILK